MACGCNKGAASAPNRLSWTVDLAGQDKLFEDGKNKKTFATVAEANLAIAKLGLQGKVRPKPATS
jgi:hypothetical protein